MTGKTICLDFDGVIHKYSKGYQGEIYDDPVEGAKEAITTMLKRGYTIVIHTAYPKPEEIKQWLKEHDMPEVMVVGGKPKAILYIDDRAIRFTNWKDILNYVR